LERYLPGGHTAGADGESMKVKDFDLEQTLECGQCFNFEKLGDHDYAVIAFSRAVHICQEGDELIFEGQSEEDIRDIWVPYFDLDRDYGEIKEALCEAEPRLSGIINEFGGIHILNQEFTETLISFIISQNKNIPQIKKIVRSICEGYGSFAGNCCGTDYNAFPDRSRLKKMTEEDFRALKTGFRAPYIMDAIRADLDGDELRKKTFGEARAELTAIRGVGDKVANCVLLFSLGFRESFPVDVWIKRIMEEMYFGCDTPKNVIEEFAADRFGKWGGYAQQYLFMYARSGK